MVSTNASVIPAVDLSLVKFGDGSQSRYHNRAAAFFRPTEEIQLAALNNPFEGLQRPEENAPELVRSNPSGVQGMIAEQFEDLLRTLWPMLEEDQLGIPISFSLTDPDDPTEQDRINGMINRNKQLGLTAQAAQELPRVLRNFQTLRGILRQLRSQNMLLPHMVLADKYLPWFLLTAPVWYVTSKDEMTFDTISKDPRPDRFVIDMAKRLGTQRLADWYQLWNRRSRPFSAYQGDAIPMRLLDTIEQAKQVFDYVVIATPYHNVASTEWADPNWQKLIDPYLLGFNSKTPFMFSFLGRWSNTGLFPLASEMLAHTMGYLKEHQGGISNFGTPYWATLRDKGWSGNESSSATAILDCAYGALKAYEEHRLFSWLTEGRPEIKPVAI